MIKAVQLQVAESLYKIGDDAREREPKSAHAIIKKADQ
jgi:hypothetical protein